MWVEYGACLFMELCCKLCQTQAACPNDLFQRHCFWESVEKQAREFLLFHSLSCVAVTITNQLFGVWNSTYSSIMFFDSFLRPVLYILGVLTWWGSLANVHEFFIWIGHCVIAIESWLRQHFIYVDLLLPSLFGPEKILEEELWRLQLSKKLKRRKPWLRKM